MPLTQALRHVGIFHAVFGHPIAITPTMQTAERANARADWLEEEARELREADTIYKQADAYIDSIYFALGGLVELGINPDGLWHIVHQANMAKRWPDGTVRKRESDGKIIKPDNWVDPEPLIRAEIDTQIRYANRNLGFTE